MKFTTLWAALVAVGCGEPGASAPMDAMVAGDATPTRPDAEADATPTRPDAEADAAPPIDQAQALLDALAANDGRLAYDLTLSFDGHGEFDPGAPALAARLVLEDASWRPDAPVDLTLFAPNLCNRSARGAAWVDPEGLAFARDLAVSFGDETVTLLAGSLHLDEAAGDVLVGAARVERTFRLCDTEETVAATVRLRAVLERTPPAVRAESPAVLPPFPRYAVVTDELATFQAPTLLVADGVDWPTSPAEEGEASPCGPEARRATAPLPWGAAVRLALPEIADLGGATAPAIDHPLGTIVAAPAGPYAVSFEAENLSSFAIIGGVELLGPESPLPADDGAWRVRAAGDTPWSLAFEVDAPADPMSRLEFSVRTLLGVVQYGTDTSVSPRITTLTVRVGAGDAGESVAFELPVPTFDATTSEAVPLSVPLGAFAGRRVVVQFDAAGTCAYDGCGGRTCTDVLLDGLAVAP